MVNPNTKLQIQALNHTLNVWPTEMGQRYGTPVTYQDGDDMQLYNFSLGNNNFIVEIYLDNESEFAGRVTTKKSNRVVFDRFYKSYTSLQKGMSGKAWCLFNNW